MARQRWLRELSRKTGEQQGTLQSRGFSLVRPDEGDFEESEKKSLIRMIDWDAMASARGVGLRPAGCA